MKTASTLLLVGLTVATAACGGGTSSGEPPRTPGTGDARARHAETIAKLDRFLADPADGEPTEISRFVNASPDVLVVFRAPFVHFDGVSDDVNSLLLVGFAAGNARAQLRSGVKKDEPVEGVRGTLAVYRWLKTKRPGLGIARLEEFAAKEASGELAAHVEALAK